MLSHAGRAGVSRPAAPFLDSGFFLLLRHFAMLSGAGQPYSLQRTSA
jgi:hypothetical protein